MGAIIFRFGQTSSKWLSKDDGNTGIRESIVELITPKCLTNPKKKKRVTQQQEIQQPLVVKRENIITLEQWLLASPALKKRSSTDNEGELCMFTQISNWVFMKTDSKEQEDLIITCRSREKMSSPSFPARSNDGKMRKKVSFREPELVEIFLFNSAEMS